MTTTIKVGMADFKITTRPNKLITLGLGSCVGICILDKSTGIIGMAHIMLPSSALARDSKNLAKFADTAIPGMIQQMIAMGAKKNFMIAKIAGGARMFSNATTDIMQIGNRNVISTKEILSEWGIPLLAEETGGRVGRTIEFDSETGELLIKVVGMDDQVL